MNIKMSLKYLVYKWEPMLPFTLRTSCSDFQDKKQYKHLKIDCENQRSDLLLYSSCFVLLQWHKAVTNSPLACVSTMFRADLQKLTIFILVAKNLEQLILTWQSPLSNQYESPATMHYEIAHAYFLIIDG